MNVRDRHEGSCALSGSCSLRYVLKNIRSRRHRIFSVIVCFWQTHQWYQASTSAAQTHFNQFRKRASTTNPKGTRGVVGPRCRLNEAHCSLRALIFLVARARARGWWSHTRVSCRSEPNHDKCSPKERQQGEGEPSLSWASFTAIQLLLWSSSREQPFPGWVNLHPAAALQPPPRPSGPALMAHILSASAASTGITSPCNLWVFYWINYFLNERIAIKTLNLTKYSLERLFCNPDNFPGGFAQNPWAQMYGGLLLLV